MALSSRKSKINEALSNAHLVWFTLYASFAAFCLYTSIYAFRKSFTAATFDGLEYAGHSYKSWLIISQVLGYGAAKFFGIKYIAELNPNKRTSGILLMVGIAALSWLLFALVPAPYNIVFLFMNGFPLGLVWGMVFGFLEGRRMTEVLGASLSVSFIFSAGLCRSVGSYLMRDWGVSQTWMPLAACGVFFIPLLLFLFLLDKLPPPSPLDEELRTKRRPMNGEQRKQFVNTFLPGIIFFVLGYMLLTAFRDIRENFAADVWKILGYGNQPGIYTQTETPVSISVLLIMGSIMLIKNNKTALMVNHAIIMAGMVLIGISTFLFQQELISAPLWMILIGLGLYLGYVPFNSIFFDRLIAAFRYVGTVGFIMYVADAFGYLGSIGVLLFKESGVTQQNWLQFFVTSGYYISFAGTALIGASMVYFHFKHKSLVQLASS
jgi:hypothetical protein